MELMKISDTALKVSLSHEDMEYYDIDFDALDYSSAKTRQIISSILEKANKTLGFFALHENLYIQAFRSKCGGCELFVTRGEKDSKCRATFRFGDINLLAKACACLENCGFCGDSRLFFGDDGRFYLVLDANEERILHLEELGKRLKYSEAYLNEHAKFVCENAAEKMAKLI